MNKIPLVSICCITYNQENYIKQAIEGFLMQKTNFPIEIIIHDDASIDKTADIIRSYEKKYPNIIKPIYQKENQWSKGIKPAPTFVWPKARGKYIAICEGDDYWTDPYKLQKQVDFLEENPEYGLVHTDNSIFYENSKKFIKSNKHNNSFIPPSGDILKTLFLYNLISTLTVVVKRELLVNVYKKLLNESVYIVDYSIWLELAKHTKVKYLDEVTAVYRVSDNTMSRPASKKVFLKWVNDIYSMKDYALLHSNLDTGFLDIYRKETIKKRLRYQYKPRFFEKKFSHIPLHDMTLSYSPRGFYDKLLLFLYKKSCGRYCYLILKYFHFIFKINKL